jgi:hypothetical protein
MKKISFSIFVIISIIFYSFISIKAYSPHYLPGGKNYISTDNVFKVNMDVRSIEPFLIKPYTEYTFSVSRDYVDGAPFYLTLTFYDNEGYLFEITEDRNSLDFDIDLNVYYLSFISPANANYLEFTFNDNGDYEPSKVFVGIQLEEGNLPTEYESYIKGSVIDTKSPYFIGSGTIISYFDQPITIEEIQGSLSAYDDIDGDLTENIFVIEDNYTSNMNILGSYHVVFAVSDNSGNQTETTVIVEVVDLLSPVFSELGIIDAVYPNIYTPEAILSMLSASDNYDGDISENIILANDGYSDFADVVGEYQMEFRVSDSSGNESVYFQTIRVVDNQGPVFGGSDAISVGYNQTINYQTVINGLTVIDNYDEVSELEIILENDSYTPNHNKLGQYEMKFSCTDSSGNKTYKIVIINIVDEIGPMVYFDSSIIQVYSDTVLSLPDFANLLIKTQELDSNSSYYITIKYDSYTKYSTFPGTYHMYLDFEDGYGRVLSKNFEIRVVDRQYDQIFMPEISDIYTPNFWQKYSFLIIGSSSTLIISGISAIGYFIIKKKLISIN